MGRSLLGGMVDALRGLDRVVVWVGRRCALLGARIVVLSDYGDRF